MLKDIIIKVNDDRSHEIEPSRKSSFASSWQRGSIGARHQKSSKSYMSSGSTLLQPFQSLIEKTMKDGDFSNPDRFHASNMEAEQLFIHSFAVQ